MAKPLDTPSAHPMPDHGDHSAGQMAHEGRESVAPPISAKDNAIFIHNSSGKASDVPPQFNTESIYNSEKVHPQGAFSPEGPPAKVFNGLGPDGFKLDNGVLTGTSVDKDGASHRVIKDFNKNTRVEDVLHQDGTSDFITSKSDVPGAPFKGASFRDVKSFNLDGTLKSDTTDDLTKGPGQDQQNVHAEKEFDHGKPIMDNRRWQGADGQWHEKNWMKDSEGKQYTSVMDGDTTTKRTTKPDGSWTQSYNDGKTITISNSDDAVKK